MTTDGRWHESHRRYITNVARGAETLPTWWKSYEERRACSQEERIVRQIAAESTWNSSPLEGIWERLRVFASPADNFQMNRAKLIAFVRRAGVTAPRLRDSLADLFIAGLSKYNTPDHTNECINALHLCKTLELCLNDALFREVVSSHCFSDIKNVVDCGAGCLESVTLTEIGLGVERLMRDYCPGSDEHNEHHLQTVERLMAVEDAMTTSGLVDLDRASFSTLLFSPHSGYLVATFLKHILEVCGRQLKPPFGTLPVLPLRWVSSTEPLPFDVHCPKDADALLIRDFEQNEHLQTLTSEGRTNPQSGLRKVVR